MQTRLRARPVRGEVCTDSGVWELMIRLAAALALLCSASTAAWSGRLPTAIEFRTAYCIPMITWSLQQLDDQQRMLEHELRARSHRGLPARYAGVSDGSLQASLKSSRKQSASEHSALHRLQQYLAASRPRTRSSRPQTGRPARGRRHETDNRSNWQMSGQVRARGRHSGLHDSAVRRQRLVAALRRLRKTGLASPLACPTAARSAAEAVGSGSLASGLAQPA